jgi:hypothetical protein
MMNFLTQKLTKVGKKERVLKMKIQKKQQSYQILNLLKLFKNTRYGVILIIINCIVNNNPNDELSCAIDYKGWKEGKMIENEKQ